VDDGFHDLSDPWRRPAQALSAIQAPVGTWADKLRVARLRSQLGKPPIDDLLQRPERSTRRHLEELGFGPQIIDRFFQPFLAGIFLDATLETSSRMFEFVFRMFSQGDAAIPAGGMERIPQQLASRLPTGAIRTNVRVTQRDGTAAVTSEGERIAGRVLVVATDGSTAAHLVPDLQVPDWRGVHGLYFAAGQPPLQEAMLALNGNGRGLVNNLCVISQVAPEYAPEGASLVSVSVLESASLDDKSLAAAVQDELVEWFGPQVALWRHLRTYAIPQALPAQRPPGLGPRPVRVSGAPRVYVCGDHRWTSSIEGAIASGLEAASAVLEDLR